MVCPIDNCEQVLTLIPIVKEHLEKQHELDEPDVKKLLVTIERI